MGSYAIAIDIGGTFTDTVLRHESGITWVDKTLTTPGDLLEALFLGIDRTLKHAQIKSPDVDDVIVHATTVVTNSLIERTGPVTALILTAGFRDVLYIRNEHRYDMYDPQIEFPLPIVPRELTFEINERTYATGEIGKTVEKDEILKICKQLESLNVQSVAICLINSYVNASNEIKIKNELISYFGEKMFVTLSSEVAPQIREYPRASTSVINAFAEPLTKPYLNSLRLKLNKQGFRNTPLIMLSSGGVIGTEVAGSFPVRMIESGPAAGALAASYFSELLGINDLFSFDMGGTTAKACIIQDRKPLLSGSFEVGRHYRFKPGSGLPVSVSSIDMIEIGAGGGSIAWQDKIGLLKVGPKSAGAEPGPVCYGRGGTSITVTDADLYMGILDAEHFLGGEMNLDFEKTEEAMGRLASSLGVSPMKAAVGIYDVVNESMASAARAHAIDRGVDYRGLPVFAFGGAGPAHACKVAQLLDSCKVIFPPLASVLSAFGTLVTPVRLDLARGAVSKLENLDWIRIADLLEQMIDEGRKALGQAGLQENEIVFTFGADVRYYGQQNEVTVQLPKNPAADRDNDIIRTVFEKEYKILYGITLPQVNIEIVTWRVTATGVQKPQGKTKWVTSEHMEPKGQRKVYLDDTPQVFKVYSRPTIAAGQDVNGPVIIEERETTIVIPMGWKAIVDDTGCIIATR
jgi:N-methylhydantoinase A